MTYGLFVLLNGFGLCRVGHPTVRYLQLYVRLRCRPYARLTVDYDRGGGRVGTHGKPKWQPRKTIVYVGLEGDKKEFAGLDWAVAFLFGAGIQQFQLSSTSRFRTPAQI